MILLGIDSLLLLYINAGLGVFMLAFLQKIFKHPVEANILGVVLSGLIFSTFYGNLVSFWFPVNYYWLIPLFLLSSVALFKNSESTKKFLSSVRQNVKLILLPSNLWFTIPVFATLLYYWIIPASNPDSAGYHYLTILWYEKFKVIPGLANVHGRFGFNPASFIIQAPYSFTNIVGQALYPLNGVIISLFILWLLTKVLKNKKSVTGIIYAVLFFMLNWYCLINLSNPSPDPLFTICVSYAILKYFDALLSNKVTVTVVLVPLLITAFAFIAKISAYPVLLVIPFMLYLLGRNEKLLPFTLKLFIICLPLYASWFCRNIILSGYLVYPIPYIDIFNFDWKAPKDVLMLDYVFIRQQPKLFSMDCAYLKTFTFPHWIIPWIRQHPYHKMLTELTIFFLAMLSPFYWIIIYLKRKKIPGSLFMLWLIMFIGSCLWLINSPEYRFGMAFLSFTIMIPVLFVVLTSPQKTKPFINIALATTFIFLSTYYIYHAHAKKTTYAFTPGDCWLYPLKDKRYYYKNNKADFKYVVLNTGVKLYMDDRFHECINTDLPCMEWKYGVIEMRGNKMEDGFRNVKDEVSIYYPFVK